MADPHGAADIRHRDFGHVVVDLRDHNSEENAAHADENSRTKHRRRSGTGGSFGRRRGLRERKRDIVHVRHHVTTRHSMDATTASIGMSIDFTVPLLQTTYQCGKSRYGGSIRKLKSLHYCRAPNALIAQAT